MIRGSAGVFWGGKGLKKTTALTARGRNERTGRYRAVSKLARPGPRERACRNRKPRRRKDGRASGPLSNSPGKTRSQRESPSRVNAGVHTSGREVRGPFATVWRRTEKGLKSVAHKRSLVRLSSRDSSGKRGL